MAPLPTPTLDRSSQTTANDTYLRLAAWLRQGEANVPALSTVTQAKPQSVQTIAPYLRFYLTPDTAALLPLAAIREVVMVPRQGILPVPHMPRSVLGAYNCRGTICWLIDLAVQLGYAPVPFAPMPHRMRQPSAAAVAPCSMERLPTIALAFDHRPLAIVVSQVIDIEVHPIEQLQPPSADLFPATVLPFVKGYFKPSHSPVLDLRSLLTAFNHPTASNGTTPNAAARVLPLTV